MLIEYFHNWTFLASSMNWFHQLFLLSLTIAVPSWLEISFILQNKTEQNPLLLPRTTVFLKIRVYHLLTPHSHISPWNKIYFFLILWLEFLIWKSLVTPELSNIFSLLTLLELNMTFNTCFFLFLAFLILRLWDFMLSWFSN